MRKPSYSVHGVYVYTFTSQLEISPRTALHRTSAAALVWEADPGKSKYGHETANAGQDLPSHILYVHVYTKVYVCVTCIYVHREECGLHTVYSTHQKHLHRYQVDENQSRERNIL